MCFSKNYYAVDYSDVTIPDFVSRKILASRVLMRRSSVVKAVLVPAHDKFLACNLDLLT